MTTEHLIADCGFRDWGAYITCSCGSYLVRRTSSFPDFAGRNRAIETAWGDHSGNGTLADWLKEHARQRREERRIEWRTEVACVGCGRLFHGAGLLCRECRQSDPTPDVVDATPPDDQD